jgi:hypothetical protein
VGGRPHPSIEGPHALSPAAAAEIRRLIHEAVEALRCPAGVRPFLGETDDWRFFFAPAGAKLVFNDIYGDGGRRNVASPEDALYAVHRQAETICPETIHYVCDEKGLEKGLFALFVDKFGFNPDMAARTISSISPLAIEEEKEGDAGVSGRIVPASEGG